MCPEKIHPPPPEIERGENTPPQKTALLKTMQNGPVFLKIKNKWFLIARITISGRHINSTIVFFILCAKILKKTASDYQL